MIVVIIAGGSGTRLWPLSSSDYPKHLLKINADKLSLLQRTYQRARTITDKVYVVSEKSHINHVKDQLKELPSENLICEPGRRGTANCIVMSLAHITKRHEKDEPVAFFHSDHYIRDINGFNYTFKIADALAKNMDKIVLVGAEPDNPSTAFGYIEKGTVVSDQPLVFNVKSFKEKPDFDIAKSYLYSGNYLWNCGYFVATVSCFIENMKEYATDLYTRYIRLVSEDISSLERTYLSFENEAIDYALIEKVAELVVIPANFDWMDLGSFSDLADAIGGNEKGNNTLGHVEVMEVENSLIHNYEKKPIAVIGLDNIVVINNKNGILVTRKDLSQKVGEIGKKFTGK